MKSLGVDNEINGDRRHCYVRSSPSPMVSFLGLRAEKWFGAWRKPHVRRPTHNVICISEPWKPTGVPPPVCGSAPGIFIYQPEISYERQNDYPFIIIVPIVLSVYNNYIVALARESLSTVKHEIFMVFFFKFEDSTLQASASPPPVVPMTVATVVGT